LLLEGLHEMVDKLRDAYALDEPIAAEERLRRMAWAYFEFFQAEPHYLHFLVALDRGHFREVVAPLVYQKVLEVSLEGLEWAMRAIAQGIAEGTLRPCDARQAAATVWAALNGVLELMAHPLRRDMIGLRSQVLYETTLETVIRGLQSSIL
jgi:AcrR family transcriptional regulator